MAGQEKWNKIVAVTDSKIYHLAEWGALLNKACGQELVYLREEKGVFPLAHVKSLFFGNRLISLPFADYGGFCAKDGETAERLIARADKAAKGLKVDFLEVRTPEERHFDYFEKNGFQRREDYFTFVIDLDNKKTEDLWREAGKKNRNMVRIARKNNIKIAIARDKSDLMAFYRLYLKTMKRLGSPPQSYVFFETIWDLFYPKNLLMSLAVANGETLAGGLFFLHKGNIHHAYSCSAAERPILGANNLIQWSVIEWGKNQGFKQLDFGRTRENAGNVLFKKRWGGNLVKMPYFYKFYKKELKERQEIKYQRLSGLWAKCLPEFLAERIGPWLVKQIG